MVKTPFTFVKSLSYLRLNKDFKVLKNNDLCKNKFILTSLLLTIFTSHTSLANNEASVCSPKASVQQEDCTFVLLNGDTNKLTIINKRRALTRLSPFSTFKIPNSLIAFESGIVAEIDTPISYSLEDYPTESWWPKIWLQQEHSIKSAFKYSVVPIYRTIANQIGRSTMQNMLNRFDYGNKNISSGLDNFWLDKSLTISAIEQVNFLSKLQRESLNVKPSSYEKLKAIMLVEKTNEYQLYAKTGGGQINENTAQGWYVGYVIKGKTPYYFALHIEANKFNYVRDKRIEIAKEELIRADVLPSTSLSGF